MEGKFADKYNAALNNKVKAQNLFNEMMNEFSIGNKLIHDSLV